MGRSPCCDEIGLKKGPWTPEEDRKLVNHIAKHGHGSWRALPKLAGLNRCGKSCRLRWKNYLRPDIKRGKFSQEEEQTILNLHAILGNKWSAIATHLPGRTDNEIKNFWNTHIKKKLIQMDYDPMTHQPRTDIFSSLSHLIAMANLKELLDYQPWQQSAASLQRESVQLARPQCFQHLMQPQASAEAEANNTNSMNSGFMDNDAISLLSSLSSVTNNNSPTQFENSNSSLEVASGDLQFVSDSISFSHMPDLKTTRCACEPQPPLSNKDMNMMVQVPESMAFCQGEISPNSPWLLSCSSTTPSPSHVAPPVTEASAIWPVLLLEDPLFNEIF